MICVTILKSKDETNGFIIEGHSMKGNKGSDILCAAVSAVSQSIVIGIVKVLDINIILERKDGYLYCQIPDHIGEELKEKANILILTLIYSLMDIEKQFPDEVKITY